MNARKQKKQRKRGKIKIKERNQGQYGQPNQHEVTVQGKHRAVINLVNGKKQQQIDRSFKYDNQINRKLIKNSDKHE